MKKILLFTTLLIFSIEIHSKVLVGESIKVEKDVPAWYASYEDSLINNQDGRAYSKENIIECRRVEELNGVHLCLNLTQNGMNQSLARATSFIEGLAGPKGVLIDHNKPELAQFLREIGGHDLRGKDLILFYKEAMQACEKSNHDKNICLSNQEQDLFESYLLPEIAKNPNFVVITFAVLSNMNYEDVVTHEIMHAQYFTDDLFRETIDNFWEKKVSSTDKEKIIHILSSAGYNMDDELLMKNEFQAYILQSNAEKGLLVEFVEKYSESLRAKLAKKNRSPLMIKW